MRISRASICVLAGVAVATAFILMANVGLRSGATERTAGQHTVASQQSNAIATYSIVAGDASVSTYGLDPARTTDW